jgi:succinylglutamate desuccinylase
MVYFVYANLKAMELNKRFYEKNMNRCFLKNNNGNTYEDKRVSEIMNILDRSDYLLDIHNTIGEKNSIPFLISEYKEFGKYFDVDYIVS